MIKKRLEVSSVSLILIGTLLLLLTSCSFPWSSPKDPKPEQDGTGVVNQDKKVIICQLKSEPSGLDPLMTDNTVSSVVTSNIYEGLLAFKETSLEIEPCLAESYFISEDNKTFTFKLRQNVKFQDGATFDAEAVIVNLNRMRSVGGNDYLSRKLADVIGKVEKVDNYTVRVELKYAFTPFLSALAMNVLTPMVSPAIIKLAGDAREQPVGTGPFKFKKWEKGKSIELEKNNTYWRKKPLIDEIIFKIDALSTSNARALLKNGEIDIIDLDKAKDDKNAFYYKTDTLFTTFIALNCSKQPFSDVNIRRAVAMGINRQEIFEKYFGNGNFANTFIPPEVPGHNSLLTFYPYNIKTATELVKKAKLKSNKVFAYDTYFQNPAVYEELRSSMMKIGIDMIIRDNLSENDFMEIMDKNSYDMIMAGWMCDNGDADNYAGLVDSKAKGQNSSKYSNKKVDELLEKGVAMKNGEARNKVYMEVQQIVQDDAAIIPMFHAGRTYGLSPRVKNFGVHPTGAILFKNIDVN